MLVIHQAWDMGTLTQEKLVVLAKVCMLKHAFLS
jgi:hypothetical protein